MKINTNQKNSEVLKFNLNIQIDNEIICKGSIIINYKENDRPIGLIEDIWTKESHRKQGLATLIVKELIKIANDFNCYKCMLYCADHNKNFYEKIGFKINQNSMRYSL